MKSRPNLLFITSDQHSQRITGCYGDQTVETPNLDALANKGVVFDNAYCPAPISAPCRASLLTGQHPSKQKCWTISDILPSDILTFPHALGAANYKPVLIGRMDAIGPDQRHGYVERYIGEHSSIWVGAADDHKLGILDNANMGSQVSVQKSGIGQSSYEVKDHEVTDSAIDYLHQIANQRKNGDNDPFTLSVGYILPHSPYVCSKEQFNKYKERVRMPKIPISKNEHAYPAWWRQFNNFNDLSSKEILRARAAYYGLITTMDDNIGRLIKTLEELGLSENTLVIYSSDHGDHVGERGFWGKLTLYDESVKIPLIISWPGVLPENERRSQIVNLVDIGPTILEALNAPSLPNAQGHSFLSVGIDKSSHWINQTFSEYCTDGMHAKWLGLTPVQQRMVRYEEWKLIYYHGDRPQLFNLEKDPTETMDLAEDEKSKSVRDALVEMVLSNWEPKLIAAEMTAKYSDKKILSAWAEKQKPDNSERWEIKEEDNWLETK
jgi:choline-sulfatase